MRPGQQSLPPIEHFFGVLAEDLRRLTASEPSPPDIRREQDLREYLQRAFGATLPGTACCHGHVSPWQVFCDAYFARQNVIVWKGSRGFVGKTWLLAMLAVMEATTLRASVSILAGSGGQSRRVHRAMDHLWAHHGAPLYMVDGEPGVTRTKFRGGHDIEALTASQTSVRGVHGQRLRIDEADEMDLRIFDAATGQTLSAEGVLSQTLITSTHQHPDGTFSEILRRAAEKGWAVAETCYRETLQPHGWLDPAEVQRKRTEMTEQMWRVEVELQEPSAEGRAIETEAVERMFRRELGDWEGKAGDEETAAGEPSHMGSYATGADWGKRRDYTTFATIRTDCRPMQFVAFYRDRHKPYHLMVPKFNERVRRYPGSAAHDAHGIGEMTRESITVEAEGYTQWAGQPRIALFSDYIAAIEKGDLLAPLSEPWYRAHRYVTNADLYGAGHPPDEFIACALAYRAARFGGAPLDLVTGGVDVDGQADDPAYAALVLKYEQAYGVKSEE